MAYYKPLEYKDSIMSVNNQRVMVARLNECKKINFGSMVSYSHNSICTHTITVDWNSPVAKAIIAQINDQNNPYIKMTLDNERTWVAMDDVYENNSTKIYHSRFAEYLSDFQMQSKSLNQLRKQELDFNPKSKTNNDDLESNDFVNIIDFVKLNTIYEYNCNWIDLDRLLVYKVALESCFNYIRPDMYFNYLFRVIVKYDFQDKNKPIPENDILLKLYKEISSKFLRDNCNIFLSEKSELSFSWEIYHNNYSKEIEHFRDCTLDFINYNDNVKKAIGIEENENPYFSIKSSKFFDDIIIMGLRLAYTRILNEIDNKEFFGAEIVLNELKLYVTPIGFKNLSKIHKLNPNERNEIFFDYLSKSQINKLDSEDLKLIYQSPLILEYKNRLFYHYKMEGDFMNDFMSKRINKTLFASLWIESQINFKEINTKEKKIRAEEMLSEFKCQFDIGLISEEKYESARKILYPITTND